MLRDLIFFTFLLSSVGLCANETSFSVGPHLVYSGMEDSRGKELHGFLGGVTVRAEMECDCYFSGLDLEGSWSAGHYTSKMCERSTLKEYFVTWKIGRTFVLRMLEDPCCPCLWVRPYLGVGYDYFKNRQNPEGTNLEYTYRKVFIPLGLEAYVRVSYCARLGLHIQWRPDVHSRLKLLSSHLDTHNEYAYRVEVPFEIGLWSDCGCLAVNIVPFFDKSRYGRVKEKSPSGAPMKISALDRWYGGLRFLVGYHF